MPVFCVATAAMRSAQNSAYIIEHIHRRYNIKCRIIDPGIEVMFAGLGCIQDFTDGISLFIDMGGRSTEVALFYKKNYIFKLLRWIAMPYGLHNKKHYRSVNYFRNLRRHTA